MTGWDSGPLDDFFSVEVSVGDAGGEDADKELLLA